jgi:hypothetical protein
MIAKTAAQRKAAERQRHKDAGRAELRGIYTYPECVPAIKACAEKTTQRAEKRKGKTA